jgi:hypothetical protein
VTAIRIVFLAAFTGGLLLAVFAMLHGVERTRSKRTGVPSPFFNLPAIAAFAVGFGAVGYPLASRTRLPAWSVVVIATASGALAISAMITLLARWALRGVTPSSASTDHEIQGQLAVVTQTITPSVPGEISYGHLGTEVKLPAKGVGVKSLPAGAEVVIDRIEDGVALVEEWAVVEQRL